MMEYDLRMWIDRTRGLLTTIGAQRPADHEWVVEARRLLEILRDLKEAGRLPDWAERDGGEAA